MKLEEAIKHYEELASEKGDPISGVTSRVKTLPSKNKKYHDFD